ncbi:MAG: carbon starvation protein A [Bdellovibrionota bacterium]
MALLALLVGSALIFAFAYKYYGDFLKKAFGLSDKNKAPSYSMQDNVDFVPTNPFVVFGHHFSSIAGAGPIVGPVLAALYFGWLPALLWIILGSIFVGGVHDLGSLLASMRHKAGNVADVARDYMGSFAGKLFLVFIYLALLYVIIVFLDLTALTFTQEGNVATSSNLFILLAVVFGISTKLFKNFSLSKQLVVFLPLLLLGIAAGEWYPITGVPEFLGSQKFFWSAMLLIYCFVASITPVWALLQPRDFLSSFLLYGAILGGAIGIVLGVFQGNTALTAHWPAVVMESELKNIGIAPLGMIFPVLFITIACGACSGFHSLVSAGTTARQVKSESDAFKIGYGAMLIEGLVAVISLTTVIILSFQKESFGSPLSVFANGIGNFLSSLGLSQSTGTHFAYLAISTFLLTTLDTCTRISRYIIQDIFSWDNAVSKNRIIATALAIAVPAIFAFMTLTDASGNPIPLWKAIWPIFGASNQLLAALALLAVTVWLKRTGRKYIFALVPMILMLLVTLSALALMFYEQGFNLLGGIALGLFILGLLILKESWKAFTLPQANHETVLV